MDDENNADPLHSYLVDSGQHVRGLAHTQRRGRFVQDQQISMATMNVSLPDPMKDWVEAQARTGRYSNANDYVRDLIRRDQTRNDKIAAMQSFVDTGLQSGVGIRSNDELFAEAMARTSKSWVLSFLSKRKRTLLRSPSKVPVCSEQAMQSTTTMNFSQYLICIGQSTHRARTG